MEDKRKNRFYEIRIFLRLCLALVFMLVLTGCEPRMMGTKSECSVHSVEGTSGANEFICRNSTDTYIYHKNAIYNYDTMEKLVDAEELTSMACNDDVLYYCIEMPSEVYCYDFSEEKSTLVKDKFASGMKANGDDVFIAFGYMTDEYVVNVEYYNKDKEGIFLNDWVEEHEPAEVNDIYEIYEFEGYRIVVDATKKLENKNIIYIENEDGFEFSCCGEYGRVCTDSDSCILSKINGEYLHLSKDVTFRYKGEKIQFSLFCKK